VKIHLTAETQFFFGFTSFPEKKKKMSKEGKEDVSLRERERNNP
jgi:hypothetical protein